MKVYTESVISEMKTTHENRAAGVLCTLTGPCMEFGNKPNRNNRIYSKKLVENRILHNTTVQECIKNRSMLGEGGHPENRIDISYPQVGIACTKLWIPEGDGNLLYGEFDILDTPTGRILHTLAQYGTKIGISARAVADSVQRDGHEVILENSYELITFDAVTEPGFKSARLEKSDTLSRPIENMTTSELKESSAALKAFKNPVFESRIRTLDKEICKREKRVDINSLLESVNRLSNVLDGSIDKLQSIKYEKQLKYLINEAKLLISETRSHKTDLNNALSDKYRQISNTCDNSCNVSRFNDSTNESVDSNKFFNDNSDSVLYKMCSKFRRTYYE